MTSETSKTSETAYPQASARACVPEGAPDLDIDGLLANPDVHVIVCCGSGGVGKTTTAAALGLRAAEQGRKVCVLTIDPAKRLAQSMGLTELDNTPRTVKGLRYSEGPDSEGPDSEKPASEKSEAAESTGHLDAMMLDMKRTFDEIVMSHSDAERAQAILDNPFYQSLSSSFAGTQEYMAMEKLGQLRASAQESGRWDLIIVDTPPSRSALDFLDAPKRLGSFLDGRLMKLLSVPARGAGRITGRVVAAGFGVFSGVMTKIIGAQMLRDLQTFVTSFDALFGGFRARAESTYTQLQSPDTRFVVVAAPERDALREAAYFVDRLAGEKMPLAGLVVNRVQLVPLPELSAETALAAAEHLEDNNKDMTTSELLRLHAGKIQSSRRQRGLVDRFCSAHPTVPVVAVGALPGDVHDLDGLREIGDSLAIG